MIEWKEVKKENYGKLLEDSRHFASMRDDSSFSPGGTLTVWDDDFEEYSRRKLKLSYLADSFQRLINRDLRKFKISGKFLENKHEHMR